jgi:polysaccharide pyruvyl transferase CsaB
MDFYPPKVYLIHGYLGYDNYGDELLAALVANKISNEKYKFAIDKPKILRLSSANTWLEHLRLIKQADELICVGGLFQDASGPASPVYYFLTVLVARLLGKKVRYLAQGIGPFRSSKSKLLARLAFKMADLVSVRDKNSSIFLKEWGVDHYHGSDLLWTLYQDTNIQSELLHKELEPERKNAIDQKFGEYSNSKLTIVCLKAPKNHPNIESYAEKLSAKILDDIGSEPTLILEMQGSDSRIHNIFSQIFRDATAKPLLWIQAKDYSPYELIYIFENYCSSIISMRLHALILGHIAGLSVTAIPVDPKINEFMHQVDIYTLETLKERADKHHEKVLLLDID